MRRHAWGSRIGLLSVLGVGAASALGVAGPAGIATAAAADSLAVGGSTGLRTPESFLGKHRALRTIALIVGQNGVQTLGGRFFMKEGSEGFVVSTETIHENLISGQEWDDNTFSANNFRHPWQGGMYFSAARANGYGFYASSMYALAGSWLWEYTGEAHHPSYNDMVNTHIGGIAFGEFMHRVSSMVLDNTSTGSNRAWRELAGFCISPTRGVNRMLTGEAFAVHANPPDRNPATKSIAFEFGIRTLGEDRLWDSATGRAFLSFEGVYGDRFADLAKPYDNFYFGMQFNLSNSPHGIGRIALHGCLGGKPLGSRDDRQQILAAYQDLDYLDNEAYTYGGQSFGVGYQARFRSGERTALRTALFTNAILLGATKSDYPSIAGREYDFGPGAGAKFVAALARDGHELILFSHESYYIHSVSGTALDSYVDITTARFLLPLRGWAVLGADYVLYHAERNYRDYADVSARNPELRAYLLWHLE